MLQNLDDIDWILSPSLSRVFESLQKHELALEALIRPHQILVFVELVRRFPNLKVMVNHAAKPHIKVGQIDLWSKAISALAENEQVYCKVSGLLTEAELGQELY